jgi:hypothetical protein
LPEYSNASTSSRISSYSEAVSQTPPSSSSSSSSSGAGASTSSALGTSFAPSPAERVAPTAGGAPSRTATGPE